MFVTGRLKDLLIIDGRNHYPQDIEKNVEKCHPSIRKNCVAAFSIENDRETKVVIMAEIERAYSRKANDLDHSHVIKSIRRTVAEVHDLHVDHVLLTKIGTIPKTSSGKIQRRLCKSNFLSNQIELIA